MLICRTREDHRSRNNAGHSMEHSTSAGYHHVHLADDLAQFHHSEAVHAA